MCICSEQFHVYNKIERKYRDFPHIHPFTCMASPVIDITHQNGGCFGGFFWEGGLFCLVLFFTKDEPMLAHHYHPKSIIYLRVVHSLSVAHSIDLDKSIVKYIHHYNISQSASLKIPELCPFIFPATHHPWQPPIFILAP